MAGLDALLTTYSEVPSGAQLVADRSTSAPFQPCGQLAFALESAIYGESIRTDFVDLLEL